MKIALRFFSVYCFLTLWVCNVSAQDGEAIADSFYIPDAFSIGISVNTGLLKPYIAGSKEDVQDFKADISSKQLPLQLYFAPRITLEWRIIKGLYVSHSVGYFRQSFRSIYTGSGYTDDEWTWEQQYDFEGVQIVPICIAYHLFKNENYAGKINLLIGQNESYLEKLSYKIGPGNRQVAVQRGVKKTRDIIFIETGIAVEVPLDDKFSIEFGAIYNRSFPFQTSPAVWLFTKDEFQDFGLNYHSILLSVGIKI